MEGAFNTLPFPMQLMLFRRMQDEERQRQAMQQARGQAGQVLLDQFGRPQQGPALPPPPMQAANDGPPPAPPPGTLSPGGGNPQAQQPQGAIAPPPQMGMPPQQAGPAGPPAAPMAPPQQPLPPFRPMPTSDPAAAGPSAIPAPPGMEEELQVPPREPKPLDIRNIVVGLQQSGVAPAQVMNVLDQLAPTMNAQNKQELASLKAETAAQTAATRAYAATMQAWKAQEDLRIKAVAEERRREGEQRRLAESQMKIKLMDARAAALAGGQNNLKKIEPLYGQGQDGRPDMTGGPIGSRVITKTGRIMFLDVEGNQVPQLAGVTASEERAGRVSVRDTVRSNLVEGSASNAVNRLNEIEAQHPGGTVSLLFGKSPGDSLLMGGAHAAVRSQQDPTQQDIDAKWAAFIDEAIPVFTGGLRGSDAFRKFLIEQAPQPGAKPDVIKEKMRLFRENIEGTRKAFANKFAADPKMWGEGVTKEQVGGRGAAPKPAANPPAAGAVQQGYRFKGGDPSKPENWEKVQ